MRGGRRAWLGGPLVLAMVGVLTIVPISMAQEPTPRVPGAWFGALSPGDCFDDAWTPEGGFDFATGPLIVPCDQPHHNEVVAMPVMGDGDFPPGDLEPMVVDLCEPAYEAFLGRPVAEALMRTSAYWPDAQDWAAGARSAVCTVYTDDRVVGTARSGSLRAPGERLAVLHQPGDDADLWIMDAGTGELLDLTQGRWTEVRDVPAWRPDGTGIAFSMEESPGDTGIVELVAESGLVVPLVVGPGTQDGPAFSPDGTSLAFITHIDSEYDIVTRDLASEADTRLTTHTDRDSNPDWSPDGDWIAFRRRTEGQTDIWVMRRDGSDATPLTSGPANDHSPQWSPDGRRIVFSSDRSGDLEIWIMDADGSGLRRLTQHPAVDDFPAWSSDGAFIAFQSDRYLGQTLWLMRADGSEQTELAGVHAIGWPRFAPAPARSPAPSSSP